MTTTPEEGEEQLPPGVPVLFDHCKSVYDGMLAKARPDNDGNMLYEGHLTHLILDELNFSAPYYTKTLQALKRMGCIRQLRRGGAGTPSLWEVVREPDEDAFRSGVNRGMTRSQKVNSYEQRLADLSKRVSDLEDLAQMLVEVNNSRIEEKSA
jgi:hypothetical protein